MVNVCHSCDYKKNTTDGLCLSHNYSDGLPYRCSGYWAKKKLRFFEYFLDVFTTAMKNKWSERIYIDLFAGPGWNRIRATGEFIKGGPLIGISLKYPFTKYLFVDQSEQVCMALRQRLVNRGNTRIFNGDCNNRDIIKNLTCEIPQNALSVCIIDPTTANIWFRTIKMLTRERRMDLVINFPFDMAINRRLRDHYQTAAETPLDRYFGSTDWREIFKRTENSSRAEKRRAFLDLYIGHLRKIGYTRFNKGEEVRFKSTKKNVFLYSLLFASKHERGLDFWNKITKYADDPQNSLPF